MQAMIKINETCARGLIMLGQEVYALHHDGTEELIEGGINEMWKYKKCEFGIEGELFGKPYEEDDEDRSDEQRELKGDRRESN